MIRVPGLGNLLFSADPMDVEYVLNNVDLFPKPDVFTIMEPLFGKGIFAVSGHEWLVQRKAGDCSSVLFVWSLCGGFGLMAAGGRGDRFCFVPRCVIGV